MIKNKMSFLNKDLKKTNADLRKTNMDLRKFDRDLTDRNARANIF